MNDVNDVDMLEDCVQDVDDASVDSVLRTLIPRHVIPLRILSFVLSSMLYFYCIIIIHEYLGCLYLHGE